MTTQLLTLFGIRSETKAVPDVKSTMAFDWSYLTIVLLFNIGFMLDVWSHSTFGPDQSVFSAYHALFYSSVIGIAGILLVTAFHNLQRGIAWHQTIPRGYRLSFLGVLIFGVAGFADLIGHALYGFETDIETLVSPSHIGIFISWGLMSSGPMLAIIERASADERISFGQVFPVALSWGSALFAITLMFNIVPPLGGPYALQLARTIFQLEDVGAEVVVAGVYIQTILLFGALLWLIYRVRLPRGGIIILFTVFGITGLVTALPTLMIPTMVMGGIFTEILYRVIQPTRSQVVRFRLFGFLAPIPFWLFHYGFIAGLNIGGGLSVTAYIWAGSVFHAAVLGFGLAYLMTQSQTIQSHEEA